jgi:DNA topoisomerase I
VNPQISAAGTNPVDCAHDAGLRYVRDQSTAGIVRKKRGRGFVYYLPNGTQVRDSQTLKRIRSLVIPPAWTQVWICPQENGHLQAVGRDGKRRKQYRYHPRYRRVRDQVKFDRMLLFGAALPRIRRRVSRDLKVAGMPRAKVLATVVRLLDETCVRVGNGEYVRSNGSFGLTTLHNKHVSVQGSMLRLRFPGKSGQKLDVKLRDDQLARIVRRCQDLPGEELFQYESDSGQLVAISSGDINDYLREITGQDITAKDFRTWHGTGYMLVHLTEVGPARSETEAKRNLVAAVKATAAKLCNRPATCRKYYIHPAVIESYTTQELFQFRPENKSHSGLRGYETALLALLRHFESRRAASSRTHFSRKTAQRSNGKALPLAS